MLYPGYGQSRYGGFLGFEPVQKVNLVLETTYLPTGLFRPNDERASIKIGFIDIAWLWSYPVPLSGTQM